MRHTTRRSRFAGAVALALHVLAGVGEARAEGADADARRSAKLLNEGIQAVHDERYATALGLFRESYELFRRPEALWNIVGAEIELGRNAAALRDLDVYVAEFGQLSAKDRSQAIELREKLQEKLARVEIVVSVPGASVTADGLKVEATGDERVVWLDPGERVIRAEAQGWSPVEKRIMLKEGDRKKEVLDLPGPPQRQAPPVLERRSGLDPDARQRVVGLTLLGVGLSGLITSGILLGMTLEKRTAMRALCDEERCPDQSAGISYRVLQQEARSLARGVDISLTLGAAVSVIGLCFTLEPSPAVAGPPAPPVRRVAVSIGEVPRGAIFSLGGEW